MKPEPGGSARTGHVIVLWNGGRPYKGKLVRELCGRISRPHLERFPAYAPELNPDEGVWKLVANGRPRDRFDLRLA